MQGNELLKQIKLFLFDMDGTLYLGNRVVDFTNELLSTIRENGADYLFMTNNSSKSVLDYVKKLENLGVKATKDDFLTSSQATAYYLNNNFKGANLYVCGTKSFKDELISAGFTVTEDLDKVDLIVMGFDTELTFKKLEDVSRLLLTRDIPYIATNPDLVCPTEFGSVPDCGSVSIMLKNATGKEPLFIGKPSPLMPTLAMAKKGVSPAETAVVGDRIYTDIKSGVNAGAHSILVMSGETTEEILNASDVKPEMVLPDCSYITAAIK